MSITRETKTRTGQQAGAFDIRSFIAILLGIYGVVLVLAGLFGTSDADLRRSGGLNINLWAGVGMVVVATAFQLWATRRPVIVPEDTAAETAGQAAPAAEESEEARR